MPNGFQVYGGTANPALVSAICNELRIMPGLAKIKRFADGEIHLQILDNVRGSDIFIVQPTCAPANDNLMELLLMIDAMKRASAARITAVLPYFGYARQDRKDRPRVPISAKLVASMIEEAGADRVLTMDLHSAPIQGFFDIPVDHLYALPVMLDYFRNVEKLTVVSPDTGGVARARLMAKKLNAPLAIIDKRREEANVSEVMNVIGDVKGRNCLLVDDMIDTAGTLVKGAKALKDAEALSVRGCAAHGVLSYDHKDNISAEDKIEESVLEEVVVTDSIPPHGKVTGVEIITGGPVFIKRSTKIHALSVAPLMAKAIESIHRSTSVSDLFV